MRVDPEKSAYHEAETAKAEFNKNELRGLRILLRRLRFLEAQIAKQGGLANGGGSGGAAFAEWEAEALAWVLYDLGYIDEPKEKV